VFSQKTDVQVEVGAAVGLCRHSILRDQYKGRKKNRFHRCEHCQNHKGRIKGW
jgi:hypothetical protein